MSDTPEPKPKYRPRAKKGGQKVRRLTCSLYEPELVRLKTMAKERGVTVSHMVTLAIIGEPGFDMPAALERAEQELGTVVTSDFLKFLTSFVEVMNYKVTIKEVLEAHRKAGIQG